MSLRSITLFSKLNAAPSLASRSASSHTRKTSKTDANEFNILNVKNKKELYNITEPKEMDPSLTASKPNSLGEKFPPGSWWADETDFETGFDAPKKRTTKKKNL